MLNYYQYGDFNPRSTLVFIHGFCLNNTCFQKQVLFFKGSHSILLIDLPGFGNSEAIQAQSIAEMADLVIEVLRHLEIEQVTIFGHSMGAYVALSMATKIPSQMKGLGLIHSTAKADNEERIAKRKQVASFIQNKGLAAYINSFIPSLFAAQANADPINQAVQMGLGSSQAGVLNAIHAMMLRPHLTALLAQVQFPIFWAIGKHDTLLPELDLFEQAATCKMAYIAYLKNAAHMGMMEDSAYLNQEISNYLQFI